MKNETNLQSNPMVKVFISIENLHNQKSLSSFIPIILHSLNFELSCMSEVMNSHQEQYVVEITSKQNPETIKHQLEDTSAFNLFQPLL